MLAGDDPPVEIGKNGRVAVPHGHIGHFHKHGRGRRRRGGGFRNRAAVDGIGSLGGDPGLKVGGEFISRTGGGDPAISQGENVADPGEQLLGAMGRQDHLHASGHPLGQKGGQLPAGFRVQPVKGFVQHQQTGILGQGAKDQQFAQLAGGEAVHGAVQSVRHPQTLDRFAVPADGALRDALGMDRRRVFKFGADFRARRGAAVDSAGEMVRLGAEDFPFQQPAAGFKPDADHGPGGNSPVQPTRHGGKLPGQRPGQARLPRAVGADHRPVLSRPNLPSQFLNHPPIPQADGGVGKLDQRRRNGFHSEVIRAGDRRNRSWRRSG